MINTNDIYVGGVILKGIPLLEYLVKDYGTMLRDIHTNRDSYKVDDTTLKEYSTYLRDGLNECKKALRGRVRQATQDNIGINRVHTYDR